MRTLIFILLFIAVKSHAQGKRIRHELSAGLIERGLTNVDSTINLKNDSKLVSNYLGKFKTSSGKVFHVLRTYYAFNLKSSPTIESHIFLYNENQKFVGYYYVGSLEYLPKSLSNNKLYFKLSNEKCKQESIINFSKGIPRFINIKCVDNNYFEFLTK